MQYIIKILSIKNKQFVKQIVHVLSKLPGMDLEKVVMGLKQLPFEIPIETAHEEIVKIDEALRSYGVDLKIIISENFSEGSAPKKEESKPVETPQQPKQQSGNLEEEKRLEEKTKLFQEHQKRQRSKRKKKDNEYGTFSYKELFKGKKQKLPLKQKIIATIIFGALIGVPVFISQQEQQKNNSKSSQKQKSAKTQKQQTKQKQYAPTEEEDLEAQIVVHDDPELLSEEYYQNAKKAKSYLEVEKLLEKAVKINQYLDKAWDMLIEKHTFYENFGKVKEATQRKYQLSTKFKKEIGKVIKQENIKRSKYKLTPKALTFTIPISNKPIFYKKSKRMWQKLKTKHSDKHFVFRNDVKGKNKIEFQVNKGEIFPFIKDI